MKNGFSSKNRFFIAVCLILAVLAVAVGGTLAVYTSQDHQRSVVRNRDNDTIRFSSDKLYRVMSGTAPQKYYYPMGEEERTMNFYVCNYDQAKTTLFSEKDIEYQIQFSVKNGTAAGEGYRISNGSSEKNIANNGACSFTDKLSGGKKSSNSYSFTFAEGDFNKVELTVTVTPANAALTQERILNGILVPIEQVMTQGVTVRSEFTDSARSGPDDFDAYNLSVTISGGAGDVLITWDHDMLDIDPFFQNKENVRVTGGGLIASMNSEDETGSYLIQFYNHKSEKPGWTDWADIPIYVELQSGDAQTGTQ